MVHDIIDGNMHVICYTNIDAIIAPSCVQRIKMEQNGIGNSVEFILLGLYHNTGALNEFEFSINLLKSFFFFSHLNSIRIQVLGGYFSDRMGGQRVIFVAAIGWSLITFWMPELLVLTPRQWYYTIPFIVTIRILNGAFQGVHFPSMISITSQVFIK